MQLQRSLFSFYKVLIKKPPLCIWIAIALIISIIISWQIIQFSKKQPAYHFEKCFAQYYNYTRPDKQSMQKPQQKTKPIPVTQSNSTASKEQENDQIPYYLKGEYFNIINKTTTIRIFLSQDIKYSPDFPSCTIILNSQKIHFNQEQQEQQYLQLKEQNMQEQDRQKKEIKILQQVDLNQTKKQKINQSTIQQQQQTQHNKTSQQSRPKNIKNFNQITREQKLFLSTHHPIMHLASNQHIIYLNQDEKYLEKHAVHMHTIILSKQEINPFPEWFGMSSRWWRFHQKPEIQRNAITFLSLGETLSAISNHIKEFYLAQFNTVNMLIAYKIMNEKNKNTQKNSTANGTNIESNKTNANDSTSNDTTKVVPNPNPNQQAYDSLPLKQIPFQYINPLSQIKVYFHYPEQLHTQSLQKIVNVLTTKSEWLINIFFALFLFFQYLIVSIIMGLIVRYLFFFIVTVYLFLGGCLINNQWGWVKSYFNIVRNRGQNASLISSCKILTMFAIALLGMLGMFALGCKYILQDLYIYSMSFSETFYAQMVLKNFFLIELFYFVCCRSRISLKHFPLISAQVTVLLSFYSANFYFYNVAWFANLHLWVHMLLMIIFAGVQNVILNQTYYSDLTPSLEKPRALYYAGYDISWQNTLPPIWTYFTTYFDYKHFDQRQRSLIDRDYQLLYGRLLGMNERQQLPQDQMNDHQEQVDKLNQNLNENNEMRLIQ